MIINCSLYVDIKGSLMITILYNSALMTFDHSLFDKDDVSLRAIDSESFNLATLDVKHSFVDQESAKILFIYPSLESVIFNAAQKSIDPLNSLNEWNKYINFAIKVVKLNRNRCFLINELSLSTQSKQLNKLTGCQLFNSHTIHPDAVIIPAVFKLIVNSYLTNDPVLKRSVNQAVALECIDSNDENVSCKDTINSACQEWYLAQQSSEQLTQELANTKSMLFQKQNTEVSSANDENRLLLEQLHLVQEALEEKILDHESLLNENGILLEQVHHYQERVDQLLKSEKSLNLEIDKLKQNLKQYKFNFNHLQSQLASKSLLAKFKSRRRALKNAKVIECSSLFDAEWYLKTYPDVADHATFKSRPALHYLQIGGFEGRNPSTDFDSDRYLTMNRDVEEQQMNPLLHFILHGEAEGRKPLP